MDLEEFKILSAIKRENLLMPEILKSLVSLGGQAESSELRETIQSDSTLVPEDYVAFQKTAKSGNQYRPFDFDFNFAIRNLEIAGFLLRPKSGLIELTDKGREIDPEKMSVEKEIRQVTKPIWQQKHAQNQLNKLKKSADKIISTISSDAFVGIQRDGTISVDDLVPQWKQRLLKALKQLSPKKFELFSRLLVKSMGVKIDPSIGVQLSGDGGLDGYGYITSDEFRTARVAIQSKKWEGTVSSPEIDKFRGAMDKYNAEFGIFITTGTFSQGALAASRIGTRVITMIDGDRLVDLAAKYELHVTPVTTYQLDDFFNEEI
ncbi:restriction endonuclease [Oenococcus kitaharae]|uniref:restriction endonuclease n=1 Tax=Oenococcus TaxID=46254 RepID=UPI0021E94421|nr:restriction endonuclease [Oenococcus kitaharae]MCV3296245.1 restriction endonuclease [Oenococcus kitaharae]